MSLPIAFEGRGTAGPPLILVHGFPLDRSMWRAQLDGLASVARVVALDLPGFGATPAPGDGKTPRTMDAMADAVLALADALGFARFVLAGLSMGGYVAFALRRKAPERLLALALCDTRAEPDSDEIRAARVADAERATSEGISFLVEKMLPRLVGPRTWRERRGLVDALDGMIRRATWAGVAAAQRGMGERPDARPELASIDVPTLVVVGADDVITPPAGARAMAAAIPGAELVEVPDAGHMAPFEQPAIVNDALARLVRRVR